MARMQVVLKLGNHSWDSIKDYYVDAFARIAELLGEEEDLILRNMGMGIQLRIERKWAAVDIAAWLRDRGCYVQLKDLSKPTAL